MQEINRRPLRVAFVCQWFPPEPGRLSIEIASALNETPGFTVNVITGVPNYPTGKVLPGYKAWKPMTEVISGMIVQRSPLFPSHDQSPLGRTLNYSSFAISAAIFGLKTLRSADVSLVYSSPVTASLPALFARIVFRTPYVAIVQDLWPDVVLDSGMISNKRLESLIRRPLAYVSNLTYRHASHLFAITPGMRADLINRGIKENSVSVFYNWAPEEDSVPPPKSNLLHSQLGISATDLVLLYAGNMGSTHSLSSWVEAVAAMDHAIETDQSRRIQLVLIGSGVEKAKLKALVEKLNASNIHFLERVDETAFQQCKADADAILVSLIDTPGLNTSLPSKVQSALASGCIIVGSVKGDTAAVVSDAGGIVTADLDTKSILEALKILLTQDGPSLQDRRIKARSYYDREMSKGTGLPKLINALRNYAAK